LRGPRPTRGFDVENEQGNAEKKEGDAGGQGHAAWIGNAGGVEGPTKEQIFEMKVQAQANSMIVAISKRVTRITAACDRRRRVKVREDSDTRS
jgi:hypothetical protein